MSVLTGEEVVSAVSTSIRAAFPKNVLKAIYKNTPQQNIQKPYAFVHQINAEHENQMRNTGTWHFMIDVRFHPEDNRTDIQSWARTMSVIALEAINYIKIGEQSVKARNIEYKVEDNVLHFIVSYAFRVHQVESPVPDMQNLLYGNRIKN